MIHLDPITKNSCIRLSEWIALALFFSMLGALILIALANQEKIDPAVAHQIFIEEKNR
jgi:hypothetical protein